MSISFMFNRQAWANAFGHIFTLRPMPHTVANKGYRATASSKPKIILQVTTATDTECLLAHVIITAIGGVVLGHWTCSGLFLSKHFR